MAAEEEVDPWIGRVLSERYRIVRRLGRGGMGAVYEAEHLLLRRKVALKVLLPEYADDPEIVTRFHREALAATHIGHAHIVEVHDMGRLPGGALYLVLELLSGRDLARALEDDGPFPIARAVHVMQQLTSALDAAHEKGIVHRDLKPENVFLVTKGDDRDFAKVLDFGISKFKTDALGEGAAMTKTGVPMGTAYYMAPEQAMGKRELDHRADVYALGVILYRLLTGGYPFDADTFPRLIARLVTETAPSVRNVRSDVPPELAAVVARCLEKSPDDRFASAGDLGRALAPFSALDGRPSMAPVVVRTDATADSFERTEVATAAPRGAEVAPTPAPLAVAPSTAASSTTATPARPSGVLFALAGAGAVGTLVLIGLFATGILGASPPPATVATPPVAQVHVAITTEPASAELFLDGEPIANPFDALLDGDDDDHEVRAELAGFEPYRRTLSLAFPQTLRIELRAIPAAASDAGVEAPPPPRGPRPSEVRGAAGPPTSPEVVTVPATEARPDETPPAETPPDDEPTVVPDRHELRSGGLFGGSAH